jgi:hypothetical protein
MNSGDLLSLVQSDHGLSSEHRARIIEFCKDPSVAKFLSGAAGAALGVVIGKYEKLSKTTQFLLGLAGYGIGNIVYSYINKHKDHRQFTHYNDKLKAYEMDTKRY